MEKHIRLLAVLLGAQVLLALGLSLTGPDLSAQAGNAPLLTLKAGKVDRLTLEGPDKAKVVLAKANGTWRLPESGDFPADRDKIERLLTRLKDLKQGPPVAGTEGAQERFKVSDKRFERRITLGSGADTLATLYLGTSPGMRQAHAREAKQKTVYAVALPTYDVPVKPEEWEDKTVLQIPKQEITAIDVSGLRVERVTKTEKQEAVKNREEKSEAGKPAEATWRVAGHTKKSLKPEAADKLAGLLADLRIGAVLGQAEQPAYGLKKPQLTLSVSRKNGKTVTYRLGKITGKEEYVLKASTRAEYFRLPSYTAEPLIEATKRDTLLGTRPATGAHRTNAAGTAPKG